MGVADACKVPAEQVLTTQGTALGLFLLAFEVCRPGDEAVLATPCFPPSRDCLLGAGVKVREVKLSFEQGYRLDLARIEASLSPKTRLVSIASPQNPSGVQASRADIDSLLSVMARRSPEALLFVDETYREATYGDAAPMESMAGTDPRIVTGASVSKALGAPGLRTGWLTVADAGLRARSTEQANGDTGLRTFQTRQDMAENSIQQRPDKKQPASLSFDSQAVHAGNIVNATTRR